MKNPFKIGDSVRFKDGQKDEESGIDIGGWQGRITEVDKKQKLILIALDSVALKNLPRTLQTMTQYNYMQFGTPTAKTSSRIQTILSGTTQLLPPPSRLAPRISR